FLVFGLARKGDEAVGVRGLGRTLRDGPAVDVVEASVPGDLEVLLLLPFAVDPQRIRRSHRQLAGAKERRRLRRRFPPQDVRLDLLEPPERALYPFARGEHP